MKNLTAENSFSAELPKTKSLEKHNYWGKTYYWECCAWELGVTALCFDVGEDINYGFAGEYNSSAESSATGFTMWTLHKHKQVEIPRSDIG